MLLACTQNTRWLYKGHICEASLERALEGGGCGGWARGGTWALMVTIMRMAASFCLLCSGCSLSTL